MRQQKIEHKKTKKKHVHVINQRAIDGPPIIDTGSKFPNVAPEIANQPVRAIYFVNVDGMEPIQIRLMLQKLNETYSSARGGVHYMIPLRGGKIGQDILFEEEWLNVVNKTCEIKDGEIVLKDGAKGVTVIREMI